MVWSMYLLLNMVSVVLIVGVVLVSVAYLTMLERKILGYVQYRKGPNKVWFLGLFQPFSDAVKLVTKEVGVVFKSNSMVFCLCPFMMLLTMLISWMLIPCFTNIYYMNYSILFVLILSSLGGYMVLLMAWGSNSVFSLIGAIRFVAQSISYEVGFFLVVFCLMVLGESYSLSGLGVWQVYSWFGVSLMPIFFVFFFISLAELNRSPTDLVEGESELVSGYNIEFSGMSFAVIFMGEYGMIIFFCFIMLILFTNLMFYWFGLFFGMILLVIMVIYMRAMLPRVRYDELMSVCWKIVLPLVLNYLLLIFGIKFMMSILIGV